MPGGVRRVLYACVQVVLVLFLVGSAGFGGASNAHALPFSGPTPAGSGRSQSASPSPAGAPAASTPVATASPTSAVVPEEDLGSANSLLTTAVLAVLFGALLVVGRHRDRARRAAAE